jgi:hypothetical protein
MPKTKDSPAALKDLKKIIREAMVLIASKGDIEDMSEAILKRLDRIEKRIIALHADMKAIREIYTYWATHNMPPDLMEKYLKGKQKN